MALTWQAKYPMQNGRWTACCEDVSIDNSLDNYNAVEPMFAAQYLITHRIEGWESDAAKLIAFVERNLIFNDIADEPAIQFGARCVSEQKRDHNKMGCHTSRYATTLAMYNEALHGRQHLNATMTDISFRSCKRSLSLCLCFANLHKR